MKKLLSVLLVLVMVFSLAACGKKTKGDTPTNAPVTDEPAVDSTEAPAVDAATDTEGKEIKVGICIYKFDDNFMTLYRQELQRYIENDLAVSTGNTYKVTVMDGKNDQAEQTNQINNFITEGVDVLIVNLVQSTAAASVIDICKNADIPVVFINREPTSDDLALWDKITYVGADARQSGTMQGEIVLGLENKGDINGDGTVNYVMVQGDMENVDAQYRTEFSVKALTDAGLEVNKLVEQRGDWDQAKGQEITAAALTQYENDVEVVFCNNDSMAETIIQAIEAAGRTVGKDIYLLGVDALEEACTLVKEGKMTGTVLNDANGQAHQAANVAQLLVDGKTVEKTYTVDYVKITE
ncbi:MAG TPA: LacI family transcriptional regulator [Lachnospiraceae bacterium]|nr:LacI family transcriptional regulator [Lachnospiraceae bacterium]